MTRQENWNVPGELLEGLAASGLDYLPELIRILVNAAMRAEREAWLGAAAYERNPQRRGYANGYKPKTVNTRLGQITFDVPQVRQGQFYPSALEKGMRSERALHLTMAEMYVQGVSTRKVQAVIERLCGTAVSSTQVSRAAAQLDEVLESWRQRPLGKVRYLYLDARYEKVRIDGQIRDAALLIAAGVGWDGMRSILGVSVSLGEQEVHWRQFLESLVQRGLRGVQLIISDDHAGLKAARRAVFGGVAWQRCQFHLQQNAQAYVPRKGMAAQVAADIRRIFQAPDRATAEALLRATVDKYRAEASALARWMEENLPEGLTVFSFPESHRRKLRTVNLLERLNQEIRRRTRVIRIFPNEAACLRLVSAILMEMDENWQVGRKYLRMEAEEPTSPPS